MDNTKINYHIQRDDNLKPGSIIGVKRKLKGLVYYKHYGVYVGNNKVIHFTSKNPNIVGNNEIIETDFSHFLAGSNNYFVLKFPENFTEAFFKKVLKEAMRSLPLLLYPVFLGKKVLLIRTIKSIYYLYKKRQWNNYSPEETISRARSKLGETKYNLVVNNCEHFAIWCKTGIKESKQVEVILNLIPYNYIALF